jgi:hypothetical protein
MQIDRARFLGLVSAMTAACGGAQAEPPPVNVAIDVRSPPPGPAPIAVAAPPATISLTMDPAGPAAEPRPVPTEPQPIAVATSPGIWALTPLDPPKGCASLRCPMPAPWQESFRVLQHDCRGLEASLKPEAFSRFMACMMPKNGTRDTCDLLHVGTDPGECLEHWSDPPTLDPATEPKCKPIVARCNGPRRSVYGGKGTLTLAACQGILSVTKPSVEAKMIHCVTEYCDEAPRLCYIGL